MSEEQKYAINLDNKFGYLNLIDVNEIVDNCKETWFNQTLTQVNDCVVRLGIVKGEFHWHKHDNEDELFFVLRGFLHIDLRDRTVELNPNQGFNVPKGTEHRIRSTEKTVILMTEKASVKPTGD